MKRIKTTLIALALATTMGCSLFSPTPTPAPVTPPAPPAPVALPVTAANLQAACAAGNNNDCMIYQMMAAACSMSGGNIQIAMGCAVSGFAVKGAASHK